MGARASAARELHEYLVKCEEHGDVAEYESAVPCQPHARRVDDSSAESALRVWTPTPANTRTPRLSCSVLQMERWRWTSVSRCVVHGFCVVHRLYGEGLGVVAAPYCLRADMYIIISCSLFLEH